MSKAIEWVLRLQDRLSGPAQRAEQRASALERTLKRIDTATRRLSGGGFGGVGRAAEAAATRGSRAWKGMNNHIGQAQQRIGSLTGHMQTLVGLTVGLASVGYAGKMVVDAAGYKQQQLTALTGLMNSREEAAKAYQWATRFAARTPFETKGVIGALRQNLSYGFSFAESRGLIRVLGDAAAGGGQGAEGLQRLQLAIGQIRSKGRLQAEDLGQIRELGIFDNSWFAKALGPRWEDLMSAGKIRADTAIRILIDGFKKFEGQAEAQSQDILGLASTLKSRPFDLFALLMPNSGKGGALAPLQWFMKNLSDLSDFESGPGKGIQQRFEQSAGKLAKALFGPLADATEGERGIALVNRLLDRADQFSDWAELHGPAIVANLRGFGEGFKAAADGAYMLLKPLLKIMEFIDRRAGGDGSGMLGKLLGFAAGGALIGRLANIATFGMAGKLAGRGGTWAWEKFMHKATGKAPTARLPGGLFQGADGQWHMPNGKYASQRSVAAARRKAALRASRTRRLRAGSSRLMRRLPRGLRLGRVGSLLGRGGGFIARLGGLLPRVLPWLGRAFGLIRGLAGILGGPVGWALTIASLGYELYQNWEPFRNLVDSIYDGIKSWGRAMTEGLEAVWNRVPEPLRNAVETAARYSPVGLAYAGGRWVAEQFTGGPQATPVARADLAATPVALPYTGLAAGAGVGAGANVAINLYGPATGEAVKDIHTGVYDVFSTTALEGGG